MKIIAHRANINGPNHKYENKISNIEKCIEFGWDVEIDIRFINEKFYLGHDDPCDSINLEDLRLIKNKAWIHCKNLEALSIFNMMKEEFNYFWHQNDSYTLTSKGYIWSFPGEKLSKNCICVMPELNHTLNELSDIKKLKISGLCTDYPILFK